MSQIVRARVVEHLKRLRLGLVAERLDALLGAAAKKDTTYLDFLDEVLREEVDAKQRKRTTMGISVAHFPAVKTLEGFDFKAQPSIDQKLVRELATGRYIAQSENVLLFGAPGVGKTHLAIALGRAAVETGHSTLFTSATALIASLAKAENDGQLKDKLSYMNSGTCRLRSAQRISSSSSSRSGTSAAACSSRRTNSFHNGASSSVTTCSLRRSSTDSCTTATR